MRVWRARSRVANHGDNHSLDPSPCQRATRTCTHFKIQSAPAQRPGLSPPALTATASLWEAQPCSSIGFDDMNRKKREALKL